MTEVNDPLRDYWYPVFIAAELQDRPVQVRLLGERIVLWRTKDRIMAFQDICLHRGAALSVGWVDGDNLVCAYHGWSYNGAGACVRIPSIPAERGIPRKARAMAYHCTERYGLVFVCLGEPKRPIAEFPEYSDPSYRTYITGRFHWATSAARSTENFMDTSHFAWVHPGLLCDPSEQLSRQSEVDAHADGIRFETPSSVRSRLDSSQLLPTRMVYTVTMPFTIRLEQIIPGGDHLVDLFFASPVSEDESERYMIVARNYALDESDDRFRSFNIQVWTQDKPIVESQRPEELPVDLTEELHLRGPDDPSVIYRRMLKQLGVRNVT